MSAVTGTRTAERCEACDLPTVIANGALMCVWTGCARYGVDVQANRDPREHEHEPRVTS